MTDPRPTPSAEAEIETLEYQAMSAAAARPCGMHPCDVEYPALPSRWCNGCLIANLLRAGAGRAQEEGNKRERLRGYAQGIDAGLALANGTDDTKTAEIIRLRADLAAVREPGKAAVGLTRLARALATCDRCEAECDGDDDPVVLCSKCASGRLEGDEAPLAPAPAEKDRCMLCGEPRGAHTKSEADWRTVPGCTGLFKRENPNRDPLAALMAHKIEPALAAGDAILDEVLGPTPTASPATEAWERYKATLPKPVWAEYYAEADFRAGFKAALALARPVAQEETRKDPHNPNCPASDANAHARGDPAAGTEGCPDARVIA